MGKKDKYYAYEDKGINVGKVVLIVLYVLIAGCYAFFIFTNMQARSAGKEPEFFGYMIFSADKDIYPENKLQDAPEISEHAAIYAQTVDAADLRPQDVIVYNPNSTSLPAENPSLTRVQAIAETEQEGIYAIQISDNANGDPQYIIDAQVIGLAVYQTPYLGYLFDFLKSSWGIVCILVIPCGLFLIYQVVRLVKTVRQSNEDPRSIHDQIPAPATASRKRAEDVLVDTSARPMKSYQTSQPGLSSDAGRAQHHDDFKFTASKDYSLSRDANGVRYYDTRKASHNERESGEELRKPEDIRREMAESFGHAAETRSADRQPAYAFAGAEERDPYNVEMAYRRELEARTQELPVAESTEQNFSEEEGFVTTDALSKLGIQTRMTHDGLEVYVDKSKPNNMIFKFAADGSSLVISTENYQAELDLRGSDEE
ncbi:MAG TPA: hypothetical protein H9671_01455 [Firmicutes bacterium]|nr:hypothetical protein [Bacillota bacterium]